MVCAGSPHGRLQFARDPAQRPKLPPDLVTPLPMRGGRRQLTPSSLVTRILIRATLFLSRRITMRVHGCGRDEWLSHHRVQINRWERRTVVRASWRNTLHRAEKWSGRADLNGRPLAPQASALPGCATPRHDQNLSHFWPLCNTHPYAEWESISRRIACKSPRTRWVSSLRLPCLPPARPRRVQ